MGTIKLHKFMAACGVGSRRTCEEYIAAGEVAVNGETVTVVGTRIAPDQDQISWRGKLLQRSERTYLILNKPAGCITTNQDEHGRPTVFDLIKAGSARLFAVGRLDAETEGLLILTDDGDFGNRVSHPRYGVHKTYEAGTKEEPSVEQLDKLRDGILLDERMAEPLQVKPIGQDGGFYTTRIIVAEGRKRVVRRMFAAVDLPIRKLVRTAIGVFSDDTLKPGASRKLTLEERNQILEASLTSDLQPLTSATERGTK
jgi:23S rRNA pseudouridine2605 synthase